MFQVLFIEYRFGDIYAHGGMRPPYGGLPFTRGDVLKARNINNPTRNGVPCGGERTSPCGRRAKGTQQNRKRVLFISG